VGDVRIRTASTFMFNDLALEKTLGSDGCARD
jgi:hypothetical protein